MSNTEYPIGRYRLTSKALIARNPGGEPEMLGPGTEIVHGGKPAWFMVPLDDDAKVAKALAGEDNVNPHTGAPQISEDADEDVRLAKRMADAMSSALAVVLPDIVEKIVLGITKAQQPAAPAPQAPPAPPPAPVAPPPPPPPAPVAPPPPAVAEAKAGKAK